MQAGVRAAVATDLIIAVGGELLGSGTISQTATPGDEGMEAGGDETAATQGMQTGSGVCDDDLSPITGEEASRRT